VAESARGEDAVIEMSKHEVSAKLPPILRAGDVVLAMGAGDIGYIARELACRLGIHPACPHQAGAKQ